MTSVARASAATGALMRKSSRWKRALFCFSTSLSQKLARLHTPHVGQVACDVPSDTSTHGDGSGMSCAARAVELGGSCGAQADHTARTGSCGRTPAAGAQSGRTALQALCVDDGETHEAFVTADAAGSLRLLAASDVVSLPRQRVDTTGGPARRSAVAACDALACQLLPGERLCPILVHDVDFRLVAHPLLHHTATRLATPYSHWASLDGLANTPLRRAAILRFAHLATIMRADHGRFDKTLGRMVGTRGARSLWPLATCLYTPTPEPAHLPQQLHLLECADAALRAAPQARPRSDPYRAYLLEWADRVDTTPNALTPNALRGARHDYAIPKLVTTPCPDAATSAKTDPAQSREPRAPPTSLATSPASCTRRPSRFLAGWLRDVVTDLHAWLRRPTRPRRRAKPRVIGQDGFLPKARCIVRDL